MLDSNVTKLVCCSSLSKLPRFLYYLAVYCFLFSFKISCRLNAGLARLGLALVGLLAPIMFGKNQVGAKALYLHGAFKVNI